MSNRHPSRGRPPKFEGERRPVTTTLPESTLQQLEALDHDRARAILKPAAAATRPAKSRKPAVEAMTAFEGNAVIVVPPSKSLRSIKWLHLVGIAPSRFQTS